MIKPTITSLFFAPMKAYVEAQVVNLTPEMAESHLHREWWDDDCLKDRFDAQPIDRYWNWNQLAMERNGRLMAFEKVAIVAGTERPLQGAMMLSTEPVESVLDPGKPALFVELLFTAPRNRPNLRKDGHEFFQAVGTKLLTWGAWFSRESGYAGRLLLDGSPDYLQWFRKRGLQLLGLEPILYEGTRYTPMELSAAGAEQLLEVWDGR